MRKARELREAKETEVEIEGTGIRMRGWDTRHADVPAPGPYIFNKDQVRDIATGVRLGLNIALSGPTGCGKSSLPIQLAARLNQPLIRFNCDGETRVSNLRGMNKPVSEDGVLVLKFSYGLLARAMRGGYWVVLDEIDAAIPSVLFVLQSVLEEGNSRLYVPETDEVVEAEEGFQVFVTGNTLGYRGQHRAKHAGTNMLNTAFMDRFGMLLDCQYPDVKEEFARVKAHCPDVSDDYVVGICRVAEKLREDTKFRSDFSTRRCIQWARLLPHYPSGPDGFDALYTAELAFIRKLESTADAQVARELVRRLFGYDDSTG